jgi:DNA-directed RNA polymerase subunit M/transcription elongation factor TFIIS
MTKNRHRKKLELHNSLQKEEQEKQEIELHPRRYVPPECSVCIALPSNTAKQFVFVYSIRRYDELLFRYCKCEKCGNTFKHVEVIK